MSINSRIEEFRKEFESKSFEEQEKYDEELRLKFKKIEEEFNKNREESNV